MKFSDLIIYITLCPSRFRDIQKSAKNTILNEVAFIHVVGSGSAMEE